MNTRIASSIILSLSLIPAIIAGYFMFTYRVINTLLAIPMANPIILMIM